MTSSQTQPRRPHAARHTRLTLAAACGLAAPAAAQLTEPFPAVFDLESLTAAGGGDGSLGFVVAPGAGHSVASAGDVNGDGIDDIIVGSARIRGLPGTSWVVFGRSEPFPAEIDPMSLDGTNGFRLIGSHELDSFSVAGRGDINGDGLADLMIAGPWTGAYLVFGRASGFPAEVDLTALSGEDGFRLEAPAATNCATAWAGDVNGDGLDDFVLGMTGADHGFGGSSGTAYVVFGQRGGFPATLHVGSLSGDRGFKLTAHPDDRLGAAVAGAGDINGDGIDDLIIGAPGMYNEYHAHYGCGCFDPGNAYVVLGREAFPPSIDVRSLAGHDGFRIAGFGQSFAGASVSAAGDFNNDGLADVLVGAPVAGLSAIIFGRDTAGGAFPPVLSLSTLGSASGVRLVDGGAESVAGTGDVNGDGVSDVIVATPYEAPTGVYGFSYVVYGSAAPPASISLPSLDGERGFRLDGAGGAWLLSGSNGEGAASAGDVNGDGVADLLITKPGRLGVTYVVFGRMPDTPCYADCDGSGSLDFFDFLCFQNLFAAGDPQADCDESGELDFFDFLCFQNAFAAGCP